MDKLDLATSAMIINTCRTTQDTGSAPQRRHGLIKSTGGDVRLRGYMLRGDRCRRDFCGVNNREDRWFEYACHLRVARIINSLCQIDAPKVAVKRALSESGIGMFGTGLTTQTTNDDI